MVKQCGDADVGYMYDIDVAANISTLVPWNSTLATWDFDDPRCIWCGVLPGSLEKNWGNIVQFAVFTVFLSTGDTIQLAWQGLSGTACACLNFFLMSKLYPMGALGPTCSEEDDLAGLCRREPYNEYVVWADVLFVLFLFLISNAEFNTIKFGMSCHICYMMPFMNPSSSSPQVFRTIALPMILAYFIGAFIAVLATVAPRICFCRPPLLNYIWMKEDAKNVSVQMDTIWTDTIEYFSGTERSAMRYQLARRIDMTSTHIEMMRAHVAQAAWETLGFGRCSTVRQIFDTYVDGVGDVNDVMHSLKTCLFQEDFALDHEFFVRTMKGTMGSLVHTVSDVMHVCAQACASGSGEFSGQDRSDVSSAVDKLRAEQTQLHSCYLKAMPNGFAANLADEVTFSFTLSFWARKIDDFAALLLKDKKKPAFAPGHVLLRGLRDVWGPKKIFKSDHIKFCFRNFIPISLSFWIGVHGGGFSIFSPYSYVMPNTLALLISQYSGSAINKSLHRVLGVMLGKLLPILTGAFLGLLPCRSIWRSISQVSVIWTLVSALCYVYYSSLTFNYLAILVVGFAVYSMIEPCAHQDGLDLQITYAGKYEELAQVVIAITLQVIVESMLHKTSPENRAVQRLRQLSATMRSGFKAFQDGELAEMQAVTSTAMEEVSTALAEADFCDPKAQLAPGMLTPFNIDLYSSALKSLKLVVSDLNMLVVACKDWARNEAVLEDQAGTDAATSELLLAIANKDTPMLNKLLGRLDMCVEYTLEALAHCLEHRNDTPMDKQDMLNLEEVSKEISHQDAEARELYAEIFASIASWQKFNRRDQQERNGTGLTGDLDARGIVACRALQNALLHIDMVSEDIVKNNMY
eukprot:TRINITY_DN17171_c0_g1_i1.p1 TRINITY_DN17171_c0_g1~~TRINITY_DN17171_c0_g1_i1.p1  ORF type:complete len:997 (+),score=218.02 TRINITY_DN17171_c0_g1_i1:412-2991(+)